MKNGYWRQFKSNGEFDLGHSIANWLNTRIDPYLVWGYSTGFSYFDSENNAERLPIIIELMPGTKYSTSSTFSAACLKLDFIDVPDIYLINEWPYKDLQYLTAVVKRKQFIEALNSGHSVLNSINRFQMGLSVKTDIGGEGDVTFSIADGDYNFYVNESNSKLNYQPIVGIIDDGIGFLNSRFLNTEGKTRIRFFWNQNEGECSPQKLTNTTERYGVEKFNYGYEMTDTVINSVITKLPEVSRPVAESRAYKLLGYESVYSEYTHGTHILDLAAGQDEQDFLSRMDDVSIIAVQVHKHSPHYSDTSGRWLGVRMLDGVRYILERSTVVPVKTSYDIDDFLKLGVSEQFEINKNQYVRPILVNVSFGNLAGPHDGSSIFEKAIDELITAHENTPYPLSVFISAGNHKQAQCHACANVLPGEPSVFNWRINPDDRTPSFMEIWLPMEFSTSDSSLIEINVIPPGKTYGEAASVRIGQCWSLQEQSETPSCVVIGLSANQNAAGDRAMFLCAVSPTFKTNGSASVASGVWSVYISNHGETSCEINAWIERDDLTFGSVVAGRQSTFDDEHHDPLNAQGYPLQFDTPYNGVVRVEGTINGIGSGVHTRLVGARSIDNNKRAYYSGSGTRGSSQASVRRQLKIKNETDSIPVDDSIETSGAIASGTLSGAVSVISGTSVATALATRAEAMKWLSPLNQKNSTDKNHPGTKAKNPAPSGPRKNRRGKARLRY